MTIDKIEKLGDMWGSVHLHEGSKEFIVSFAGRFMPAAVYECNAREPEWLPSENTEALQEGQRAFASC